MSRPSSSLSVIIVFVVIHIQACSAKHHHQYSCPPSSCGQIRNITYPFRLNGDPRGCGLKRYELDCVNNVTLFTLFSGKYHVQEINYKTYQIRLTDPGVAEDSVCPIPRYYLSPWNFSYVGGLENYETDPLNFWDGSKSDKYFPNAVMFLNCTNSMIDYPQYVQVNARRCGHIYAFLDRHVNDYERFCVGDIKVGCRLKVATIASRRTHDKNFSYADTLKSLQEGFWLSWLLPVICRDHCGIGVKCSLNETTQQVECDPQRYCHYVYHTTTKCGYLKGLILGLLSRLTSNRKNLDDPIGQQDFDAMVFIGRNILPIFMTARYLFGVVFFIGVLIYKWHRRHLSMYDNIEIFLVDNNLNPIRYEYREIKKMTRGFKVKLGQGGFGSVYKGKLCSGPYVAIKMLNKFKTSGQEFISEVATIGRIHHMNVVRLIGYCVEGKRYALVYEYMPNGSLDKYIFSGEGSVPLSCERTYEISLGVARGIAYLHKGCDVQILHFDIKPHNILLDDNFTPKVSDFGLAKLYLVNDSIVTLTVARGTLGYMAPELFYNNVGGVSYKADVYSFGMLLMEMTSKRKNFNPFVEHSSQHNFPLWIYDQFKDEKDIDMENVSEEDKILLKRMFIIALWCIQLKPMDRPSMNKVVEMLEEKNENLEMPPRPSFYPHEMSEPDAIISSDQISWSDSTYSDAYISEPLIDNVLSS